MSALARLKKLIKKVIKPKPKIKLNPKHPTGKAILDKKKRDQKYLSL